MQGGGLGYEPPQSLASRPAVITWYRVYASITILLYVGFLAFSMLGSFTAMSHAQNGNAASAVMVIIFIGVGLLFGGFYAIAALVPYKPWGWVVGLIAICFGLSSCLVFAAVPLLIYWMKPETKAAFGRL